jgi:hypothetical protein
MQGLTQHETAAALKRKRHNGKVVHAHVMKEYVENAGTVVHILNNKKRSFTRIGKWQECG